MENKPIYSNQRTFLNASNSSQVNFLTKIPDLARPPSVPVLGRKLSNESIITIRDESLSKYPYAVQIPPKKPLKHKLSSKLFQKVPKALKKSSKTQTNTKSRSPSPLTKIKSVKKMHHKVENVKTSRTKRTSTSPARPCRTTKTPEKQNPVQMKEIVEKSLKKQKKLKKSHEKLEKQKNEAKEKLKQDIKNLNLYAREENLKNFKQKLFNPRKPWGADPKKKLKQKLESYKFDLLSKPLKSVRKSKNMTPEVSPSKRCLSARSNNFASKPQKKKKKVPRSEKENLKIIEVVPTSDLFKRPSDKKPKTKKPPKILKKCPEMKWLDDYLENLSEVSKVKSILSDRHSELPAFGIVDDFQLFEQDSRFAKELKLKNQENFSIPKFEESFDDAGLSQEFLLEENSKIVRLKKINKQKNDEIQEKILQAKAKFEEKYLNEKLFKNFQNLARGWLFRQEFQEKYQKKVEKLQNNEEDSLGDRIIQAKKLENFQSIEKIKNFRNSAKNDDSEDLSLKVSPKFEENLESSWIFKRQSPDDPESFFHDEEDVSTILKAFKIKTDKLKGINEKSKDLKAKQSQISVNPVPHPEKSLKNPSKPATAFVSDSKPADSPNKRLPQASKDCPKNLSKEPEPKGEIVQMAPVSKGKNLNLNELSQRLLQEQQNLNLLEEESKEMLKIITPEPPSLRLNSLSCDLSSEAEILRLFHEIIHKKYVNLDSILEKNIQVLKEALADSLTSKSKTESLELKKKLQRISTEESTDDLDQLLKDLIGTQDIQSIEVEVLHGFIHSFPVSRNSPVPPISEQFPIVIGAPANFEIPEFSLHPSQNLEEMLSQGSSDKTKNDQKTDSDKHSESIDLYLNQIEETLLSGLLLEALDDVFITFSEDLLVSLIETEVILLTQEFKQAFSDHSIFCFTHEIFSKFSHLIFNELKDFKQDDPLDLLSMMQESEIGSGHFPEILFAVIDPRLFLEIISEDPLFVCIFKKMIFDCVNETLNKFISRVPTPWGTGKVEKKNCEISQLFGKVAEKMQKCAEFKMGKIFVPGEADFGIIQLREQKIVEVINFENMEIEEKWVNYGFEEDQVKLDLADMVLELLVEEGIEIALY